MSLGWRCLLWVVLGVASLPGCHKALPASHADAAADAGNGTDAAVDGSKADAATDAGNGADLAADGSKADEPADAGNGADPASDGSKADAAMDAGNGTDAAVDGNQADQPAPPPIDATATVPDLCSGVVQLTADLFHACAVKSEGTLWCWGANGFGQLGDGTTDDRPSPVAVTALGSDVVQAATGYDFTCAVKRDGTLWCWGANDSGELGAGDSPASAALPIQVSALGSGVAEVAAGGEHACARKLDGTLWCWGARWVGDGSPAGKHSTPTKVSSLGAAVAGISVSWGNACARLTDGSLWCWGGNEGGQLGDGTTNHAPAPVEVTTLGRLVTQVSAGYQDTCAIKSDGTLWCWGWRSGTQTPAMVASLGTDVAAVAMGRNHFCARKRDGTLWCWGGNGTGQLGDGTTSFRSTPAQVPGITGAADVAATNDFTCAVVAGGALRCWGSEGFGELGNGVTSAQPSPRVVTALGNDVAQLTAGYQSFCARKLGGTVACWGLNLAGSLDGSMSYQPIPAEAAVPGRAAASVAASDGGATCAVSTAGEVWCWGLLSNANRSFDLVTVAVQVAGLPADIIEVAVGWGHACALARAGTLWCWGRNDYGELGDGSDAPFRATPVEVETLGPTVRHVTAADSHTCAQTADGSLWCWGANDYGELGDGTTDSRATPLPVTALGTKVRQAAAGSADHTCAVLDDGTAWCWGRNDNGELGNGTLEQSTVPVQVAGLTAAVQVSTGGAHTCARADDGALWCWGSGSVGQLGDGRSGQAAKATIPVQVVGLASKAVEVTVGPGATCARDENNAGWCWGVMGMLGDGTTGITPSAVAPAGCR
jgi:alpha-tubulin suppressor-like RCC1 family protein